MKWPFTKAPAPSTSPNAERALKDAQKRLDSIRSHEIEVHELVDGLREHRRSDHFTDLIREAYRRM